MIRSTLIPSSETDGPIAEMNFCEGKARRGNGAGTMTKEKRSYHRNSTGIFLEQVLHFSKPQQKSIGSSVLWIGIICLLLLPGLISAGQPPNIIILYSDDAGYADFGFQKETAKDMRQLTPHIDSIAKSGVTLTNAYMSGCVCSPSRAGLMSGRYQQRFGFGNNLPPAFKSGVDLNETFGVKRLKSLGYHTGLVGKWHLGYPAAYHPNKRGFDWFYGLLQGSRNYYPYKKPTPHRVILENSNPTPEGGYITDRFGDAAVRYIKKNKDKPFFLFVSFTAPHGPNQPNKKDADRIKHITKNQRRNYAGLVVSLDDNVGKILKAIDTAGIANNTLVIFTNDNGGATHTGANNGSLKGKKGNLWEGGIRVPWAMRWPGTIQPGTHIHDPIISLDILPTTIEMAGKKVQPQWKLDGRSFLPLINGKQNALPERPLYWRHHGSKGNRAIRQGKWKLVHQRKNNNKPELYDLSTDIGETKNLAAANPKVVTSLIKQLDQWETGLIEPRWAPRGKAKKKNKNTK